MKWTLTLVAEPEPGQLTEHQLAQIERGDAITPASLGLSIAEVKAIVAIQTAMVTAQVQRHGESARRCPHCSRSRRTKGYYTAIVRSVFGKVPMRVRRLRACPCHDTGRDTASVLATKRNPIAPELRYLTAKLAALMPFAKVATFLDEVLPTSTRTHASTVRNRTRRVGQRLERHEDGRATPSHEPPAEIVVGFDGGYVKNRQPRPERTFEVIAGKVIGDDDLTTCFAFVRRGSASGGAVIAQLLRQHGMGPNTRVTVLSDGEAGLRAIQRAAAPHAEHVLDWFHLAMRFRHLTQLAKGIPDRETREGATDTLERAKWQVWNGESPRALAYLRI